jgi:hypothetical protein
MPSSHAPSVLALFYFVPEVRAAMLERQFDKRLYASKTVDQGKQTVQYVEQAVPRFSNSLKHSTNFVHRTRVSFQQYGEYFT